MRPLTVLQVLPALESGGVERGTLEIAQALIGAGHKALVASAGGSMVAELEALGATHITLPLKSKNPLAIYANIARLEAVIRENGVNIVHARSRAPAWSALPAARRCGVPFVTTFHAAYSHDFPLKRLYNSVMTKGAVVIAISAYIRDHIMSLYGLPPEQIALIPRGFDTARFDPARVDAARLAALREKFGLPAGMPVVLCPGRVSPVKGHEVLLKALAEIKSMPWVCLIAGGDQGRSSFTAELKELATSLGIGERVFFTGPLTIDGAVMALGDVMVSPKILPEAFGRVMVEAEAMERLVITSNAGGAPETLLPGQTGWLVPPNDAPALASALREFFALSENERRSRERKARAFVLENYTTRRMCEATLAVYERLTT